jgi:hypothetical protein
MKKIITIMVAILFSSSVAQAEQGKFRFGAEAGYAWADMGAEENAQALANAVGATVTYSYDKADLMGRVYGQYGINKNLSAEIGYFKSASLDARYTVSGVTVNETYDVNGFDLSGVYQDDSGFYGKAGVHKSEINGDLSVTVSGTRYNIASASQDGTGFLVGVGYEGKIDEKMSWTAGVTYYDSIGGLSGADATFASVGLRF